MGYEIDFLAVGDGEKSGDAIAFRCGDLFAEGRRQFVMVIDGGTKDSGDGLVDHIQTHYKTDRVDLVISGHPDADHASGLTVVLKKLSVGCLAMHRPWEHSDDIRKMFEDGTLTNDRLSQGMRLALEEARELEKIAKRKGIPVIEPFAGFGLTLPNGRIRILGPSEEYYVALLPRFRDMPELKEASFSVANVLRYMAEGAVALKNRVLESWGYETLKNPDEDATSPENNSSVICFVEVEGHGLLFTGDAGVPALTRALNHATVTGIKLTDCRVQQIPHHGSKHNVGPTILDRIVGPRLGQPGTAKMTVYASAAKKGAPKHPSRKVTNAYARRGAEVLATQGTSKCHRQSAPSRAGWVDAEPLPFYKEVEED